MNYPKLLILGGSIVLLLLLTCNNNKNSSKISYISVDEDLEILITNFVDSCVKKIPNHQNIYTVFFGKENEATVFIIIENMFYKESETKGYFIYKNMLITFVDKFDVANSYLRKIDKKTDLKKYNELGDRIPPIFEPNYKKYAISKDGRFELLDSFFFVSKLNPKIFH